MARFIICVCLILSELWISLGDYVIIEKGHPTHLECRLPRTVTSATWYVHESKYMKLASCNFVDNRCYDLAASNYQAFISCTPEYRVTSLNITSVRTNETKFSCTSDNGLDPIFFVRDVYAWPKKPVCRVSAINPFVEINCTTDNVYMRALASIHWREGNLTEADFLPGYPKTHWGPLGSGSEGDYTDSRSWGISDHILKADSTFFVQMWGYLFNYSGITNAPVISDDIIIAARTPQVVISEFSCPVGPGVGGDYILIGTNATCRCEIWPTPQQRASVQWYTKDNRTVGEDDVKDGSSTLTVSYNLADPNPEYECRPVTAFTTKVNVIRYSPKFKSCFVTVEKGKSASPECAIPSNETNVTWQLLSGDETSNLTSCGFDNYVCSNSTSPLYRAQASQSGDGKTTTLNITSVRTNETEFVCVTNNLQPIEPRCVLEVYVAPDKPVCDLRVAYDYFDFTCTTDNVYPNIHAILHRREVDFSKEDFGSAYPICSRNRLSNGDYSVSCLWRIPMTSMITDNKIFVEMTGRFSNESLVSKTAVISDDIIIPFTAPEVQVTDENCPGVREKSILMSASATCKCELKVKGSPPAFVRWFAKDNLTVYYKNSDDGSSTLTLRYDIDRNRVFICRPITPLRINVTEFIYAPQFHSSAVDTAIIGLQHSVIVLGVLCALLISPVLNS